MSSAGETGRLWTLLVRVRALRVHRCRRLLARMQQAAHEARVELMRQVTERDRHAARLPDILGLCGHGKQDATLWRSALKIHRSREAEVIAAVRTKQRALSDALTEVQVARIALQRALRAHEDAQHRKREATARLCDDE
ncbi:hypothetical protein AWB77_02616 [Caballeronia fortuita]|uniref:Uncharacterized protein n=1 Tax=Caballeronia fortuita TaxID=1777138 RepID=A0A158BBL0_9BURK|nr:hypothetical protein [Caballeronia fortuita]SAK67419.1 hypothetical protein AWB77_02616 [Caballeronia fortuita]